jgi:lysophospholipase L1-like esterase
MPKALHLAIGAFAVILVCERPANAEITSKNLGAIWFVGDSITQSNADGDSNSSPRKELYDLLNAAGGYTFTFTGHSKSNLDGLPDDDSYRYHSGISGSVIENDLEKRKGHTQNLSKFWNSGRLATVKPNVILIMLGTNDIYLPIDAANAPKRLLAFLDAIYALPDVGSPSVFLATIPPDRASEEVAARVATFNAALPEVVKDLKARGKDVTLIDQFTPLNEDFDKLMVLDALKLHPNAEGNKVIARQWFNAIEARAASKR